MTPVHWGQTGWPRNGQTTRSDMTRLFNCLGLLVVPALCLRIGGRDDAVLASGKRKRAWWMVGGKNEHGCCCAADLQSTAAPAPSRLCRKGLPSNSTRPPPPPVNVSSPMHTMYATGRLLPALWKRDPSLPPSTLPHPPSQAIGPRGAAALDLTSLPSPLSLQYCRRAR
jgi:hypothetical protein